MGQQVDDCGEFFGMAEEPEPCKCQGIVLNTYNNLLTSGVSKGEAINIASNVLRYHHPCSTSDANTIVECWVHKATDAHVH